MRVLRSPPLGVLESVFSSALCAMLLALCALAEAQSPGRKIPLIGVLFPDSPPAYASYVEAFRLGLRELGHIEGRNIHVEYRYGESKRERATALAAELVRLRTDVIVVVGGTLAAAKGATGTIPIVVGSAGDLVGSGHVASLAKPGGNITGSTNVDSDLSAKRLELLKETFPKLVRVTVFTHEGNKGDQDELREMRAAAERLAMRVQGQGIKDPGQLRNVFGEMTRERAEAMIITNNSFNFSLRRHFFEFAAAQRIPTMCGRAAFVDSGCLMSYAASREDSMRRAAYFVDKILKGAKPADLPVQQPTKFEFVINLKAAKQIGLTIPQSVLYRADRVVK